MVLHPGDGQPTVRHSPDLGYLPVVFATTAELTAAREARPFEGRTS
jgi:hypothetical protein